MLDFLLDGDKKPEIKYWEKDERIGNVRTYKYILQRTYVTKLSDLFGISQFKSKRLK